MPRNSLRKMLRTPTSRNSAARALAGTLLLSALGFAAGGCPSSGKSGDANPRTPLAEVGGRKITVADVDARLERVPRLARPEFTGPEGRSRLVNRIVEEEMLLLAAKAEGVEKDADLRDRLEEARREMVVQAYLDKKQSEASRVTGDEIEAFYGAHPEEFSTEEAVRVRMLVLPDRKRAEGARNLVAKGTVAFEEACRIHADDPDMAAAAGLVPEWVRRGRAVPWIGNHPQFHEVAFSIPQGEISPVFETPKGFIFLRVEEHRMPKLRPLEEVRADIESRLSREKSATALPKLLEELKARYKVKVFAPEGKSAEELFSRAQGAADPNERIRLYREVLEFHPSDSHAVEALFMIGFIQNEELNDRAAAKATFERVVKEFPGSELAESAKWMLSDESQKPPAFDADSAWVEGGAT